MKQADDRAYKAIETSPSLSTQEVQDSCDHSEKTSHTGSLAIYSILSGKEIKHAREVAERTPRISADKATKPHYGQPPLKFPRLQQLKEVSVEESASLAFTSLSINVEEERTDYRGATLKEIREGMGIELRTVSTKTRVNIKILEAIEGDTLEKLPPIVYLKGFLKTYAQCMGLNPEKVVEGYLQFLKESKKK